MTFRQQLYGYGMLAVGYACGQRLGNRGDFTKLPWQANFCIGCAMLVLWLVLEWRRRK